jgi:hypothetical protein
VFWGRALGWLAPGSARAAEPVTFRPLEPVPGTGRLAPAETGFRAIGETIVGVSLVGSGEGFVTGPARDEAPAAARAVRDAAGGRRRRALSELWPYVAAAAAAVLLARAWVAR